MQYTNYWTCSKFADWLRGTKQPKSATSVGWKSWRKMAREKHLLRYWLADTGLKWAQDFVYWLPNKLNDIRSYCRNRWIDQTHGLIAHKSNLKRGVWCDVSNRILPCLFDSLVDFVECEEAWMQCIIEEDDHKLSWWRKIKLFRWKPYRNKEAGIKRLEWEASLIYDQNMGINPTDKLYGLPTEQAMNAMEILALYKWYTEIYLNRKDAMDESGWSDYCDLSRNSDPDDYSLPDHDTESDELKKLGEVSHKALDQLEQDREEEDTRMMIRLIKVRNSLWT